MRTTPLPVDVKVAVSNLDIVYGATHAVRGASLWVPPTTTVALIGATGSGKSSLLRAINRLLELRSDVTITGSVRLDGAEIYAAGVDVAALRRRVGMVFEAPVLLPGSIFDNAVFGVRAAGVRERRALDVAAERALRRALLWEQVANRLSNDPRTLPAEAQQRLCLARALATDPDVLLMDDPTSTLDPVATAAIEDLIQRLRRELTVLLATTNLQQAARISDETCYLSRGEVVESGDTLVVFSRPTDTRTEDFLAGRSI